MGVFGVGQSLIIVIVDDDDAHDRTLPWPISTVHCCHVYGWNDLIFLSTNQIANATFNKFAKTNTKVILLIMVMMNIKHLNLRIR
ncbi:hypothetical protein LguiA_009393 [Lonicera macranthoides]